MKPAKKLNHLLRSIIKLFLFSAFLFLPHLVSAQIDKEFWFVAPRVHDEGSRAFNKPITLRITTTGAPANVTISLPANPAFIPITRSIAANSSITVDLTTWIDLLENTPANTVLNRGILITSTADITAYYEVVSSVCNCNPEIFSLKGKNALGTEFFISSQNTYDESTAYNGTNGFDIVATVNNTHVTITPTKTIVGHAANVPFTITLNKGETYSAIASSSSASGHLNGSYVSSDNPIAVTIKDDLVQVSSCADLIGDQTVPTSVLGTEYIVTRGYLQPNDNVYVMAIADGTSVYLDGSATAVAVLSKGQSYTINLSSNNVYIHASKNVYVYHLTGNGCEAGSAIIPKLNCTGSKSVSIVRSNDGLFALLITTKNGNQSNFLVNGSSTLVKASDFLAVTGTGGAYVSARVDLSGVISSGSNINVTNSTGSFSLGYLNGGTNDGTRYGFFSDFKSSNVQKSSVDICPSGTGQLTAYGGVAYKWTPVTGLSDPNIANPTASPTATTDYTVEITTADGCVDYAYVRVNVLSGTPPSVTITASQNNICTGTSVAFTATPVNGGTAPVYQWQVNGVNAGTNSAAFGTSALANGDKVTCIMASNGTCAGIATSNSITMVVNNLPASVSIAVSQNNICAGTSVSFTATPVNGGATPVYQWQINGVNAGANIPTYSTNTLVNTDKITCVMTSSIACTLPATSNSITMVVVAKPPASVSITAAQTDICAGTAVTFTATPVNGGASPVYQWQVNGVNAGANSNTFNSSTLANGDNVSCLMTSNAQCATPVIASSNTVTMAVKPYVTPSVSIVASADNICPDDMVTFTATSVNGGTAPVYQWRLNGNNVGTGGTTFAGNTFANGDVVTCVITSNFACVTSATAGSNSITMVVNQAVNASVSIAASANNICPGTPVTFTATPVNGGSTPVYQWFVNSNSAGLNSATFTSSSLTNNDVISCRLTSNTKCAVPAVAASNNVVMTVKPVPVINTGGDKTIEQGSSAQINATASGSIADVTWSPATGLDNVKILSPTANPTETTVYTLTVQSADGCVSTATVKVTVLKTIVIPNTFTPNGDGINDKWEIKNLSDYPACSVKIFDRWGQEVYRSTGCYNAWDGTRKGKRLPFATYYYVINLNNNTRPLTGYVVIVR